MVHQAESEAESDKLPAARYGSRTLASRNRASSSRGSSSDCSSGFEEVMGFANGRRSYCFNYVNFK